jgi:glyoxylase-like metal-dependent hydrolase (beta-lactamase superfamily II)
MRIGDLEIHLLSDGVAYVDAGGPFGLIPPELYGNYLPPKADNTVPIHLTCMFVRSRGKNILIDSGLGEKLSPEQIDRWGLVRPSGSLLEGLERLGRGPEDVDIVLNTHLHADHCSGNTRLDSGRLSATFPNAEYWVQRIEWAQASHPDDRTRGTYDGENFEPLFEMGRLRLLQGDARVTDHITCRTTPGHTRGHQSIVLESGGWHGLYVGDMATYTVHMARTAWLTAFDVLPLENIRTKKYWQRWAFEKDAWLFFEHDPYIAVGRLRETGRGLNVEPVERAAALIEGLPRQKPPLE